MSELRFGVGRAGCAFLGVGIRRGICVCYWVKRSLSKCITTHCRKTDVVLKIHGRQGENKCCSPLFLVGTCFVEGLVKCGALRSTAERKLSYTRPRKSLYVER